MVKTYWLDMAMDRARGAAGPREVRREMRRRAADGLRFSSAGGDQALRSPPWIDLDRDGRLRARVHVGVVRPQLAPAESATMDPHRAERSPTGSRSDAGLSNLATRRPRAPRWASSRARQPIDTTLTASSFWSCSFSAAEGPARPRRSSGCSTSRKGSSPSAPAKRRAFGRHAAPDDPASRRALIPSATRASTSPTVTSIRQGTGAPVVHRPPGGQGLRSSCRRTTSAERLCDTDADSTARRWIRAGRQHLVASTGDLVLFEARPVAGSSRLAETATEGSCAQVSPLRTGTPSRRPDIIAVRAAGRGRAARGESSRTAH